MSRWIYPACLVVLGGIAWPALARDLEAASTGEHLWLVEEDATAKGDQAPRLLIRHLPFEAEFGQATKLEPLPGRLMSRGVAAGDDKLLLAMDDRQLVTLRPVWSPLLRRWLHEKRELEALPEGCVLLSLAMGERGPWALVRVEDEALLRSLDVSAQSTPELDDRAKLNFILDLPEDFPAEPSPRLEQKPEQEPTPQPKDDAEPTKPGGSVETTQALAPDATDLPGPSPIAKPELPAYRLITLRQDQWVAVPLPDGFAKPRYATLLPREGDDRPTLLVEWDGGGSDRSALTRYNPVMPGEKDSADQSASAWVTQRFESRPNVGRPWSATLCQGQVVMMVERVRFSDTIQFEAYLLRGDKVIRIGNMAIPTADRARWAAVAWRGSAGVVTRPGPKLMDANTGQPMPDAIAGLSALTLEGTPRKAESEVLPIVEAQPDSLNVNADLIIQITTFLLAMATMLLNYRYALRAEQLKLPEHLILASFGRRALSGLIDLMPGFWIAGAIYGISFNETLLYWPGNGIPKVLPAMRPGFVVIGITLLHTTFAEFITARSLGKWITGLYVVDLAGRPAAPVPSLLRSIMRIFDLLAPLMIVVMAISPARQRLGDILARTVVIMHKPRPIEDNPDDEPF